MIGVLLAVTANIGAFLVLFQLYKMVRKQFIQRAETVAFANAEQIIDVEQRLHLFFELDLQRWVIGHEWMIRALNYYYAWFMWTFYACCVVAIVLSPVRYGPLRRVFPALDAAGAALVRDLPARPPALHDRVRLHRHAGGLRPQLLLRGRYGRRQPVGGDAEHAHRLEHDRRDHDRRRHPEMAPRPRPGRDPRRS